MGSRASANALEKSESLVHAGIGHPTCRLDISMVILRKQNTTDIVMKHPTPDISLAIIPKVLLIKNYI